MNAFYGIRRGVKMTASRALSFAHDDSEFRLDDFVMRSENTPAARHNNSIPNDHRKRGVGAFLPVSLSRTDFFSDGEELKSGSEFKNKNHELLDLPLYMYKRLK